LSHTALSVRLVGVARTLVRFHAMVIIWFSAILKKLVAVCGGCVMLAKPGGFVCAIEGVLEAGGGVGADAEAPDAPGAPDGAPERGAEADMASSTENWSGRTSTAITHDV
jgi:hypothetical protein